MIYHVGDPYRAITRMKGGRPVYEISKIRSISPSAEAPEILWLENDQRIDLVRPAKEGK